MVYANTVKPIADLDEEEHHPDHFYSLPAPFKAAWMARRCPEGRVVEVGCGAGYFLKAARSHGYEVLGLEPNEDYDLRLRAAGVPFVHGLLEDNCLPRNSFDVVYHCDLLVHFANPLRCLNAMCELLTDDGVLCFEVGLMGGIKPFWYKLVGNIGLGPHRWLYSNRAFRDLMSKARLSILHIQYFGLAAQVIGGRVIGLVNNRAIRPLMRSLSADRDDRAVRLQERSINFLRYRVGALLPHVGPQTVMVVAKPSLHV